MENDGKKMEGDRVSLKRSRIDFEDNESIEDDSEYNRLNEAEEEGWWREDDSEDDSEDESEEESEDLDCERNIEEHEYTISADATRTLKIRLFLTNEEMGEFNWMKNFVASLHKAPRGALLVFHAPRIPRGVYFPLDKSCY